MVPILESERLRLRGHTLEDFAPGCVMWTRLLRYVGHWQLLDYGFWVVTDKVSGAFLGEVGFADFKRDFTPALGVPEIGWALMPHAHGKGVATEAVQAALIWGDQRWPRTACLISPENTPSIRVADKCGYRPYAHITFAGTPTTLFERLTK